jgi:hypothetical protein
MPYDPQCEELAKHFGVKGKHVAKLAQVIQDYIEQYIECDIIHNHFCQQCETIIKAGCDCEDGPGMEWCSSNCHAAYDL